MERKLPVPGTFYRHFKGNIYQVRELAKHSETGEDMVVYQGMYPPFSVWVRPLSMFLDTVDHEKYPECRQQFRFEQVAFSGKVPGGANEDKIKDKAAFPANESVLMSGSVRKMGQVNLAQSEENETAVQERQPAAVSDQELRQILINDQGEKLLTGRMPEEEIARRGFLALLDAETYREKRQILVGLREYLNELYLNNLAAALDIVLEEGSSQEHYDTLLHCLETYEKYEGGRLRR